MRVLQICTDLRGLFARPTDCIADLLSSVRNVVCGRLTGCSSMLQCSLVTVGGLNGNTTFCIAKSEIRERLTLKSALRACNVEIVMKVCFCEWLVSTPR